jgi:competence ComEA-like helix-hairpin-helix protein
VGQAFSLRRALARPLGLGLVLAAIVCFSQTSSPDASLRADKATYEAICGSCHSTSIADGLRDEQEWRETIETMQGIGAKGTEEQFARVLRYLLRTQTRVNVNTASAAQIAPVLNITAAAAEALVKRRTEKGPFQSIGDLAKAGVEPAKLESRKDRIVF